MNKHERKRIAYEKYKKYISMAKANLHWARSERETGFHEYSLYAAAQNRIQAFEWYARYKKLEV